MNFMRPLLIAVVCLFAPDANAAVLLTNFGSSNFLNIDKGGFTSYSQTSNSLNIVGLDNVSGLSGGFSAAADISGQFDTLTLFGTATAAPATTFNIGLVDSSFRETVYRSNSWADLATLGAVSLNRIDSNPFNFSNVIGLNLTVGGTGSPINATLSGLTASAVPEPSRALLVMMGLASLATRRRRA